MTLTAFSTFENTPVVRDLTRRDQADLLPTMGKAHTSEWISNAAPDYLLALQGLDIADFGDGAGLSLMVYLNAYVDPSTAFNSTLTPESVAALRSVLQHQVDGWLHGTESEISLKGTNPRAIAH